jgi:hypothetical protein
MVKAFSGDSEKRNILPVCSRLSILMVPIQCKFLSLDRFRGMGSNRTVSHQITVTLQ